MQGKALRDLVHRRWRSRAFRRERNITVHACTPHTNHPCSRPCFLVTRALRERSANILIPEGTASQRHQQEPAIRFDQQPCTAGGPASPPIITSRVQSHRHCTADLYREQGYIPAHHHQSCTVAPAPRHSPVLRAGLHPCLSHQSCARNRKRGRASEWVQCVCYPRPPTAPHLGPGEWIGHRSDALRSCCNSKQHMPASFPALVPRAPAFGSAAVRQSGISASICYPSPLIRPWSHGPSYLASRCKTPASRCILANACPLQRSPGL